MGTTATVIVLLPCLNHSLEFIVHWMRGSPNLAASMASSVVFTVLWKRRRAEPALGKMLSHFSHFPTASAAAGLIDLERLASMSGGNSKVNTYSEPWKIWRAPTTSNRVFDVGHFK